MIVIVVGIGLWTHKCHRDGYVPIEWMVQMHIVGHDAVVARQRWALDGTPIPLAICVIDLTVVVAVECNAAVMSAR